MFYNTRDISKVYEMYQKMLELNIEPNKMTLGYML